MTRDEFEDYIIGNQDEFEQWAREYLMQNNVINGFLDFCWNRYLQKGGWRTIEINNPYNADEREEGMRL